MNRVKQSSLTQVTETVFDDEPCFCLSELIKHNLTGTAWHRYQIIMVVRNDRLAVFQEDLGPQEIFQRYGGLTPEFRIPGGVINNDTGRCEILHTVAELQDIADWLRLAPPKMDVEPTSKKDFQQGFYDVLDARYRKHNNQTTFGLGGKLQRGD